MHQYIYTYILFFLYSYGRLQDNIDYITPRLRKTDTAAAPAHFLGRVTADASPSNYKY